MLEYHVLGPIEVCREGHPIELTGRKARAVLAVLALRANQVVPTERLISALWGEQAPATAVAQVHKCISQLRSRLGDGRIVRRGDGYELRLGRDQLDLHAFEQYVRSARCALTNDRPLEAAEGFRAALSLWSGEALAGATEELIRAEAPALEEQKVTAHLGCIEAELALGRHEELIGELSTLVAAHPLREQLRANLMLALYRSGRVAEALTVYHEGRALLAAELGLDPGPELQRLHQAILVGGLETEVAQRAAEAVVADLPVPDELPPSIADFTGRRRQLDQVCSALTGGAPDAPVLTAICGPGGAGKTTLAVQAARRMSAAFPDGSLHVRLHDSEGRPLDPHTVLGRFLRALGVEQRQIPDDLDERAQLLRSRSARRRMLILLDDAAHEAQIRPLLPNSPSCAVLITSRRRLTGLEGARHVDLARFDPRESVELLDRVAGGERLGLDYDALLRAARLCDNLPLAVRIVAARLACYGPADGARYLRALGEHGNRLDLLVAGDLRVRQCIAVSYGRLSLRERDAFRLLGLLESPEICVLTAVSLFDVDFREAQELIEALADARLLEVVSADAAERTQYRMPDLIRLYARERAQEYFALQAPSALALSDLPAGREPVPFGRPAIGAGRAFTGRLAADVTGLESGPRPDGSGSIRILRRQRSRSLHSDDHAGPGQTGSTLPRQATRRS